MKREKKKQQKAKRLNQKRSDVNKQIKRRKSLRGSVGRRGKEGAEARRVTKEESGKRKQAINKERRKR